MNSVFSIYSHLLMPGAAFRWGTWTFDRSQWRLAHARTGPVLLPNRTLELLAFLLERAPNLVEKDEILSNVWSGATVEEGNIAFHIAALRRALDIDGGASCIETVRSRGYRFVANLEPPAETTAHVAVTAPPPPVEPPADGPVPRPPSRPEPASSGQLWRAALLIGMVAILAGALVVWIMTRNPVDAERGTTSAEAYDLVVQAREQWRQRTPGAVRQAIALYEHAIRLDPRYARAYAGLADCYNITMSGLLPDARYPLAKANAEKAVELDPMLSEGHTSLAFLRYKFEWRWQDSEDQFKQAIALDPSNALARHWYGELLALLGRTDESIEQYEQALKLEPRSLAIRADTVPPLIRAGRAGEARALLESGLKIDPNWFWFSLRMAEVYQAEGRERESVESEWRGMTLMGVPLDRIGALQDAYRAGGMAEMLRARIARNLEIFQDTPSVFRVATDLSLDYARLGDKERALHWLGVAISRREDAAHMLLIQPAYDVIRGDPQFKQLLEKVGLPLPTTAAK